MPRGLKRKRSDPFVQRIPRPANPFIIFRSDRLKNSISTSTPTGCGRQKQKDISREAAEAWRNIDPNLKRFYEIQAEIIKDEHSRKYPGWVYRPKGAKEKKEKRVDDGDSETKPVAHATKPHQISSTDASGEDRTLATPSIQDDAPTETVWDTSWFSGSISMLDPFYSTPLQPLTSVSAIFNLRCGCSFLPPVLSGFSPNNTNPSQFPLHGARLWRSHHTIYARSKPRFRERRPEPPLRRSFNTRDRTTYTGVGTESRRYLQQAIWGLASRG